MNWIILLLAGLFEVSLTFCLGKARAASGLAFYLWGSGFLASTVLSMTLLAKAVQTLPLGTAYAIWTGIGAVSFKFFSIFSLWHGLDRDIRLQGAGHSHPSFLPVHAHCFLDRIENRVILKGGGR